MKKTAKILSIILSISMVLGVTIALVVSAFAVDAPAFEIKEVSAANGQLVASINLKSGTFNSLDMAFRTTGLKCTAIKPGADQPAGALVGSTSVNATGDLSNISVVAMDGYSQKGEMYVVTFDITEEEYSFDIEVTSCSITDSNYNNTDVTASVTVSGKIDATTTTEPSTEPSTEPTTKTTVPTTDDATTVTTTTTTVAGGSSADTENPSTGESVAAAVAAVAVLGVSAAAVVALRKKED